MQSKVAAIVIQCSGSGLMIRPSVTEEQVFHEGLAVNFCGERCARNVSATLASHRLNPKLITQNWDDFLRVAGSLKMGKLSASELIRALQRGSKRSPLARALGELGRIPKTLHLLTSIDDPCYSPRHSHAVESW